MSTFSLIKFFGKHTLIILLVLALSVRLYRISNPVADWHAFRQADTASVTREYVKHGINLLVPRYHDLSNIASGKDNLDGYRMVEFPINNALAAIIIQALPSSNLVLVSRLISVAWSLLGIIALYYLVKDLSGKATAVLSALTMAVLPYSVYYSHAILPEPATLACYVTSFWFFQIWTKKHSVGWLLMSTIAFALALQFKPFVIFLTPVFLTLMMINWRKQDWINPLNWLQIGLMAVASVGPLLWWRHWIEQFPSGIPANDWLFNGNKIRFRPAWARWLFWERLTKLMLGFIGIIFLFANLADLKKKTVLVYAAWWLGILTYFSVIATGNVQHDYYQVIVLPILAISVGRGLLILDKLLTRSLPQASRYFFLCSLYIAMLVLSWQQVKGYFNVNHWEYVRAGKAVDAILPADAKVIAPAFGDTMFLFQTNRTGWPIGFEIDDKIELGAEYYVSTSLDDEARELLKKYHIIEQTPEFIILDLQKPNEELP